MKKISFVIPTYNSEKTICKTIDSIYKQGYNNKEIILIDAGSTDKTLNIVKQFKEVKILHSPIKSTSLQRNLGFEKAKGEIIFFIDSDVFLKSKIIERMIAPLKSYDISFTNIDFENNVRMYPRSKETEEYMGITAFGGIKRSSLKKLDKLFDSDLFSFYLEDKDFFTRCKLFGLRCIYLKDEKVFHTNPLLEDKNQEFRFKNMIISSIFFYKKYKGIKKDLKLENLIKELMSLFFINTILNYSVRARYNAKNKGFFQKITLIFNHKKLSNNYLRLYYLYFSSLFYALRNLKKAEASREKLLKSLKMSKI